MGTRSRSNVLLGAVIALVLCGAGCGDDDDDKGGPYDSLFTAPANAPVTPGSIYGVWSFGAQTPEGSIDARLQFTPTSYVSVNRCLFADNFAVTVGFTAAATIDDKQITTTESKDDVFDDGVHRCNATARPGQQPYAIDGRNMVLGDVTLFKVRD